MTRRIDPERNSNDARSALAWPQQKIAELTRLYDEGLTCTEIGLRMGISKNAVIGKVTRLSLLRGAGFVPSKRQTERLKAQETRTQASSTFASRLDALHAVLDAKLAIPLPARIAAAKQTDNPTQRINGGVR